MDNVPIFWSDGKFLSFATFYMHGTSFHAAKIERRFYPEVSSPYIKWSKQGLASLQRPVLPNPNLDTQHLLSSFLQKNSGNFQQNFVWMAFYEGR